MANELKEKMEEFVHEIKALMEDPALASSDSHLTKIASTVSILKRQTEDISPTHEIAHEVAEIVQGILTQPLQNKEKKGVTMLDAAILYTEEKKPQELSSLLTAYVKHPDATRLLLTELEILSNELAA